MHGRVMPLGLTLAADATYKDDHMPLRDKRATDKSRLGSRATGRPATAAARSPGGP